MKKIIFGAMILAAMPALAQETYTNAEIATQDLNGTARYVGMGGAMDALGADISTIGTNPAGIGMFHRSQAALSVGLVAQDGCGSSRYTDGTNMSFDQVGFVWSNQVGENSFLNFGFNFHKSRNYNNILNVSGSLNGASQNANSYMDLMDATSIDDMTVSQLDALYYKTLVGDQDGYLYYNTASGYNLSRGTTGYMGSYDFNISGNVSNRVFLGLTIGIDDLHYKSWTSYTENLLNGSNAAIGDVTVNDYRKITGTGLNVKLGAIIFPVEESGFRMGFSIATPTWYDLNTYSYTTLTNNANTGGTPIDANYTAEAGYDYRIFTPWKFGFSLGHTLNNYIALGASYEYADYSYLRNRIIDGDSGDDYWHGGYDDRTSYNDTPMNMNTEATLRGVSTLKLGMEVKPTPQTAVRLGYNYITPMYRSQGYRDGTIASPGTYYSSTTDYTNWKDTNRLTCGFGYSVGDFVIDLAYQYNVTNGKFHPFTDSSATYSYSDGTTESVTNYADAVNVSKKRHQLLCTLTYKF